MEKYILSIDQGTTGTTALIISHDLQIKAKVNKEFKQYYPQPSWVEHDPEEIWQSALSVIQSVLKEAKISGEQIAAIGITNQRETTVLWDKTTGQSVHPAIVWQDRRTASICSDLKKQNLEKTFQNKTGLVLDPYFSGTKVQWILDNVPKTKELIQNNQLAFGTIDSFLTYQLTGGSVHVTDVTNASRTLLFNINTLNWDQELCDHLRVPQSILPEVKSCSEIYGVTKGLSVLPDGIPVSGMAGDQQAALFGQACFEEGSAKCTYGTGSFLLMNIGQKPKCSDSGLLTTVAWQINGQTTYALEGSSFIAGAAVQWLRDEMKIIQSSSEIEKLAQETPSSDGVMFVPALAGLGAPHWNPQARGLLCGLTRGSGRPQVARAVLEGIALCQVDILQAMQKDSETTLKALKVDGGAAANNLMMQYQSDVLQTNIIRPKYVETTAMGAAFLAGLAVGFWKGQDEIRASFQVDRAFEPKLSDERRGLILSRWNRAIRAVALLSEK